MDTLVNDNSTRNIILQNFLNMTSVVKMHQDMSVKTSDTYVHHESLDKSTERTLLHDILGISVNVSMHKNNLDESLGISNLQHFLNRTMVSNVFRDITENIPNTSMHQHSWDNTKDITVCLNITTETTDATENQDILDDKIIGNSIYQYFTNVTKVTSRHGDIPRESKATKMNTHLTLYIPIFWQKTRHLTRASITNVFLFAIVLNSSNLHCLLGWKSLDFHHLFV